MCANVQPGDLRALGGGSGDQAPGSGPPLLITGGQCPGRTAERPRRGPDQSPAGPRRAAGGFGVGVSGQPVDVDIASGGGTAGGLGRGPPGEVELQVDGDLPAQERTD